jgi:hypothetical protein
MPEGGAAAPRKPRKVLVAAHPASQTRALAECGAWCGSGSCSWVVLGIT